jgi:hypothetical protein
MQFICQIALSDLGFNSPAKMAYLFMTDSDEGEFVDGTYEPDGGENAIILQPGMTELPTSEANAGPTLYRMAEKPGMDRLQPEPFDDGWQLLLQLDSCSVPFYVNFGDAGVGYAFLNKTGDKAKFLWQCG